MHETDVISDARRTETAACKWTHCDVKVMKQVLLLLLMLLSSYADVRTTVVVVIAV